MKYDRTCELCGGSSMGAVCRSCQIEASRFQADEAVRLFEAGLTYGKIAVALGISKSRMSQLIADLRQQGRIERRNPPNVSNPPGGGKVRLIRELYEQDMPLRDIAEAVDSTVSAVGVALNRMRRRGEIGRRYPNHPSAWGHAGQ